MSPIESQIPVKPQAPVESKILVGVFRDVAWARVRGKGTHRTSPALRSFAECLIEKGQWRIIVDLFECPSMDSTFMGILAQIAKMLRGRPGSMFQVINAGERNLSSLRTLGLDQVFEVDVDGASWRDERDLVDKNVSRELEQPDLDQAGNRQVILEAHEALCDANRDNVRLFQDVLKFLGKRQGA